MAGRTPIPWSEPAAGHATNRQTVAPRSSWPRFPAPVTRLGMGGLWELVDIERMVSGTGRELNYPALEAYLAAIQERHRTGEDDPDAR